MFCMKCGNQLEDGMRFCNMCGAPVEDVPAAGSAEAAFQAQQTAFMESDSRAQSAYQQPTQQMQQPYQPAQQYQQQYQQPVYVAPVAVRQPAQQKSKKGLIVGIVAAIVAVAVVLVVLFVFPGVLKGDDSSNAQPATTQQPSDGQSASSSTQAAPKPKDDSAPASTFKASEAESKARQAAVGAGKEVFTGTVHITTMHDRAKEVDPDHADQIAGTSETKLAILELDSPTTIEARSGGDMGKLISRGDGKSLALKDPDAWSSYDGKKITVAVHPVDMWYPSDVAGVLYTVTANNAVVIAPLSESTADRAIKDAGALTDETRQGIQDAEAAAQQQQQQKQEQQQSKNGDYVLPDSSTKSYSRSELDKLSTHDLFLARNEIFARYGRQFVSEELQQYFGSKSWYHGTIAPGDFDETMLNETERHNVETMLAIEKDRNSPYI